MIRRLPFTRFRVPNPWRSQFQRLEWNSFGDTRFQWELLFVGNRIQCQGFGIDNLEPHFLEWPSNLRLLELDPCLKWADVARLQGELIDSGGTANQITLYYGDADANATISDWNYSEVIGSFGKGPVPHELSGLDSGKTYFYRFEANNSAFVLVRSRILHHAFYDQGTLRINTGLDELGTGAGIFWDRGQGEQKMGSPTLSTSNYLAPDGSSWQLTKSVFDFPNGLLVGPNLDAVIVEGVNALSLNVYGNATIESQSMVRLSLCNGYVSGGTESDGHDAYYTEDPSKGFRVGRGNLGGFGGGQGPGKGFSLGSSGAGGLSGGGGSFAGEGGAGASGPSGITYGTGGMEVLVGGSGGGFGSFGDAAAGGGALEILSSGKILIGSGVKISMNGGAVLVNPSVGAKLLWRSRFGRCHPDGCG